MYIMARYQPKSIKNTLGLCSKKHETTSSRSSPKISLSPLPLNKLYTPKKTALARKPLLLRFIQNRLPGLMGLASIMTDCLSTAKWPLAIIDRYSMSSAFCCCHSFSCRAASARPAFRCFMQ